MIRSKHLKPQKTRLISLLKEAPGNNLTLRELRDSLGLARGETRSLQAFLGELGKRGIVYYHHRRYWLQASRTPKSASHTKTALPSGAKPAGSAGNRVNQKLAGASAPPRKSLPPVGSAGGVMRGAEADPAGDDTGIYSAHRRGFGFVNLDCSGRALFIPPRHGGGALDGDRVRITRKADPAAGRDVARVVAVLGRRRQQVRGYLELDRNEMWLAPLNDKLPLMYLGRPTPPADYRDGSLVEARITSFPAADDEAPVGELTQVFEDNPIPAEVVAHILADRQITPGHSPACEAEAVQASQFRVSADGRTDLRSLPFVTIDGEAARDFDDAICLQNTENGRQRLYISIADVAHYVQFGSRLDREAYEKGTSVYLPDRALPMLPEALSSDACSLRPGEPRFTMTCELTLNLQGRVTDQRFYESVISSQARLTYIQVETFFETDDPQALSNPHMADMLREMRGVAQGFAQRRREQGALQLELPEARFLLNTEGLPEKIHQVLPTEATRLIEQFMLEANERTAEEALRLGLPMLYRVHDPPPEDRAVNLQLLLHNAGVTTTVESLTTPGGVAEALDKLADHPQQAQLVVAVLKSMSQAQYRSQNDGHFGLASSCYTHFTSPIRRYPDLLLHRAFKAHWHHRNAPALPERAGAYLSDCERTAADAEQQVQRLYRVLLMERYLGERFPATVMGVSESALWVVLTDPPVEGPVPVGSLPFDRYRYDKATSTLRGTQKRRQICIGDRLMVQLVRADRGTQSLEFAYVAWDWEQGN